MTLCIVITVLVFAYNTCSFLGEELMVCVLTQCISWLSEVFNFNENETEEGVVCASEVFYCKIFTGMLS